jgi:hypothetical protein
MLNENANMRDVILSVRADEICHREVNHHFADIPSNYNIEQEMVEVVGDKIEKSSPDK